MPDDLNLNRLRELAEAALVDWDSASESGTPTPEGWAHMEAGGHPQTTLALIDRVAKAETRVAELEGLLREAAPLAYQSDLLTRISAALNTGEKDDG